MFELEAVKGHSRKAMGTHCTFKEAALSPGLSVLVARMVGLRASETLKNG